MTTKTVAQAIHAALVAIDNCEKHGNTEWLARWKAYVDRIAKECLPSGAGIDAGTRVVGRTSEGRGIELLLDYHAMNETGYYIGWTEFRAYVRPAFDGLEITLSGRNVNDCKEYLHQALHGALSAELPAHIQP
jgi:hypothetical protein